MATINSIGRFFDFRNLLNILIYLLPISFISGNYIVNLNLLLIIFFGLLIYQNKLFEIRETKEFIILFLFFAILLASSFIEYVFGEQKSDLIKSVLFLRFFIFTLVVKCHLQFQNFNYIIFLKVCFFVILIISLDVILQYLTGSNILGYASGTHNSSFFKSEAIAGSYIQRFGIFGLLSIPILFQSQKKLMILFLTIYPALLTVAIIFSGNRMPLIMFLFSLFPIIFFQNKRKKILISALLFLLVLSSVIIKNADVLSKRFGSSFRAAINISQMIGEIKNDYDELSVYKGQQFHLTPASLSGLGIGFKNKNYTNYPFITGHFQHYVTSSKLFLSDPIIGRGIKSFRNTCREIWHHPNTTCGSHPHHFYLEIMNDTGILGFGLIIIFISYLILNNFLIYRWNDQKIRFLSYTVVTLLLTEFFPFRSQGSFFSTSNATFVFFIAAISWGLIKKDNNKKTQKKV